MDLLGRLSSFEKIKVKWKQVGNKCLAKLFKLVKHKNTKAFMTELKDQHGQIFTKREDLDRRCHNFYIELYRHKDIIEDDLRGLFDKFSITYTTTMNIALTKENHAT